MITKCFKRISCKEMLNHCGTHFERGQASGMTSSSHGQLIYSLKKHTNS